MKWRMKSNSHCRFVPQPKIKLRPKEYWEYTCIVSIQRLNGLFTSSEKLIKTCMGCQAIDPAPMHLQKGKHVLIVVGGKKYPTSIWWHPSTAHANDFAIFQAQFACRNSGVPNALRVQFTLFWSLHVKFTIDRCFFSTMMAWGSCSWWFAQTFKNNVLTTQPYAHLKQQQQ